MKLPATINGLITLVSGILLAVGGSIEGTGRYVALGLGAIGTAAVFITAQIALKRQRGPDELRQCSRQVSATLDTARAFLAAGVSQASLRANVMLRIDGTGRTVWKEEGAEGLTMGSLRLYTSGYTDPERKVVWQRGRGCAGKCWETETTVLGSTERVELDGVKYMDLEHPPKIKVGIKTVLSVPLRNESGEFVGVLNFDDEASAPTSLLARPNTIYAMREIARELTRVIGEHSRAIAACGPGSAKMPSEAG